ncbi:hypothetical protein [Amycolatopsis panacis]|nr:hypothetical protein [Amycolatopsis panacis]
MTELHATDLDVRGHTQSGYARRHLASRRRDDGKHVLRHSDQLQW